jgi:hypothetical protein
MDNTILYTAKFKHHDLKFHKVWWKSNKRFGSWSGQTNRWTDGRTDRKTDRPIPIYPPNYVCGGIIKLLMNKKYNVTITRKAICQI